MYIDINSNPVVYRYTANYIHKDLYISIYNIGISEITLHNPECRLNPSEIILQPLPSSPSPLEEG